jgi:hypothetical protein
MILVGGDLTYYSFKTINKAMLDYRRKILFRILSIPNLYNTVLQQVVKQRKGPVVLLNDSDSESDASESISTENGPDSDWIIASCRRGPMSESVIRSISTEFEHKEESRSP